MCLLFLYIYMCLWVQVIMEVSRGHLIPWRWSCRLLRDTDVASEDWTPLCKSSKPLYSPQAISAGIDFNFPADDSNRSLCYCKWYSIYSTIFNTFMAVIQIKLPRIGWWSQTGCSIFHMWEMVSPAIYKGSVSPGFVCFPLLYQY